MDYIVRVNYKVLDGIDMSTASIRVRCPKCGYTHTQTSMGYVADSLGVPFMRCPVCGGISRNRYKNEWVQMSTLGKFLAISPRGIVVAVLLFGLPAYFGLGVMFGTHGIGLSTPLAVALTVVVGSFIVILSYYIIACIRVNCWSFYNRVVPSIARTRNENYKKLLSTIGKIYGEEIPPFIIFTAASRATVEYEIEHYHEKEIYIPTFAESVSRY